jgi:putative ABC transport system permease protein
MNDILGMYRYDVRVSFANRQRIERVDQQAQETPGVKGAAQWTSLSVRRIRPDGSEGDNIALLAPPADFDFFVPNITEGRSLQPGDTRALIINSGVLKKEPDIRLGHDVVLKIGGRQYTFHVVGQVLGMGMMPQVYASYDDIARITHDYGQARDFMMLTEQSDPSSQAQAATMLEAVFSQAGQHVNSAQSRTEEYASVSASFDTIIYLALVMAVLLAIVGGLGLTGTLGTNVIERTREIGVMRAIGAADGAVAQVFIVEGIVIGLLSWLFGAVLAIPMGQLFSQAIGQGFVQTSLTNVYSMEGVSLWLAVVLLVSALASFLPARNASRLTVRDVLAYE